MNKILFKFALAFVLLINTAIFVFFFEDYIYLIEIYLYPLFFIYFIVDSFTVIFPRFNDSIYSSKMEKNTYIAVQNYDASKLKKKVLKTNLTALLVFILYTSGVLLFGFSYLYFDWFDRKYLYLVFFFLNFADYFCITLWCPFSHIFFKNSCCNTCRISNWDRIMKFSILIFIPNIYTITIFIFGSLIFLYWEYNHFVHPERFYRMSNQLLWCNNCDKKTCVSKTKNINKKE